MANVDQARDSFNGPIAVIVDQRDRLIVADHLNHRVVLLDQASTWLLTIKVMSLVLRSLRAHMVLPWIFKGTSMLPPMFLAPSKSSHLRGPMSDHMVVCTIHLV